MLYDKAQRGTREDINLCIRYSVGYNATLSSYLTPICSQAGLWDFIHRSLNHTYLGRYLLVRTLPRCLRLARNCQCVWDKTCQSVMYPCSLPLGGNRIRLVRIMPGDWSDPISCELHFTALDAIHSYHTLSYVWGPPKITRPILLNGQKYQVTVNLESALRHLRHQLREETLVWIDALCINQSDGDERTHQVGLMGSIYRNCKSVLVYIGDGVDHFKQKRKSRHGDRVPPPILKFGQDGGPSPIRASVCSSERFPVHTMPKEVDKMDRVTSDTSRVFAMVETLSKAKHLQELGWAQPTDDPTTQEELRTLFELLRRFSHAPFTPWWTRIWVVQETVLPPVVTIICGSVSAPWTMFAQAASRYLDHSRGCCHRVSAKLPRDHLNVLQSFSRLIFDLDELRRTFSDTNTPEKNQLISQDQFAHVDTKEVSPATSLLSLLRRFRNRKATDPRDKVYALLSLCPNTSVLPDYAASEREVYTRAALESIYATQSLSVLHVDISRKYRHDLPSWVPDWEAQGDFSDGNRLKTLKLYRCQENTVVDQRTVSSYKNWLYIDSKFVDTIAHVDSIMLSEDPGSMSSTLCNWFQIGERLGTHASPANVGAFWRVLCADIINVPPLSDNQGSIRRAEPEDELMFAKWMLSSPRSPFTSSERSVLSSIYYRSFLSEEKRIWWNIHLLEFFITEKDFISAMQALKYVFPGIETRETLIREATEDACDADAGPAMKYLLDRTEGRLPRIDENIKYYVVDKDSLSSQEEVFDAEDGEKYRVHFLPNEVEIEFMRQYVPRAFEEGPWLKILEGAWRRLESSHGPTVRSLSVDLTGNAAIMENSILSATKSRRLFTTAKGHIGLGPASMNAGDLLCFLKGGKSPFVLREIGYAFPHEQDDFQFLPKESAIKQQRSQPVPIECYEIIGDCYAHGLMDSEETSGSQSEGNISTTSAKQEWETIVIG